MDTYGTDFGFNNSFPTDFNMRPASRTPTDSYFSLFFTNNKWNLILALCSSVAIVTGSLLVYMKNDAFAFKSARSNKMGDFGIAAIVVGALLFVVSLVKMYLNGGGSVAREKFKRSFEYKDLTNNQMSQSESVPSSSYFGAMY